MQRAGGAGCRDLEGETVTEGKKGHRMSRWEQQDAISDDFKRGLELGGRLKN